MRRSCDKVRARQEHGVLRTGDRKLLTLWNAGDLCQDTDYIQPYRPFVGPGRAASESSLPQALSAAAAGSHSSHRPAKVFVVRSLLEKEDLNVRLMSGTSRHWQREDIHAVADA